MAPLGYDTKDRKITVNEPEADLVRTIFRRYLKLGSISLLMADLRKSGLATKVRTLRTGGTVGGIPFDRGPLARFYIGQVAFKGETLDGEQPAIVNRALFDEVQTKLREQLNNHTTTRMKSEPLLVGRIFDDRGNRMTPSHARKRGVKYRYYLSSALLQGQADRSGSIRRVPAAEIEALVVRSVQEHLKLNESADVKDVVTNHVERVVVLPDHLVIQLSQTSGANGQRAKAKRRSTSPGTKRN